MGNKNVEQWKSILMDKFYQTKTINNEVNKNDVFRKEILEMLEKYKNMNWGDTCKEDWAMNDHAVLSGDERIVAKYKTSKGDVFIITEWDRSATTILFACEY